MSYRKTLPHKKWKEIFTIEWWKWCLSLKLNMSLKGRLWSAKERVRIFYIRYIKRQLLYWPLCWIRGHVEYKDSYWSYHGIRCSRCSRWIEYHTHYKEVTTKGEGPEVSHGHQEKGV